ncbi:MAG: hypothetical protein DRP96_05850 [Candidatus Neomarinimicrobiota bacterium]|nr:MAG: hypothetical protein DRP96_05850 [Candidatus Neomarinimicrobiota bacterium]
MDLCHSLRKKFVVIFNIITMTIVSLKSEILSTAVELYIGIVNSDVDITFTMTAESSVWGADD